MAPQAPRSTKSITVDPENPDEAVLYEAAVAARAGELVVFPTETVYGVGTSAFVSGAAHDIYAAKERPAGKPLILLIADPDDVYKYIEGASENALALIDRYWPGPLTLIFKKAPVVPDEVTAGGMTVGLRCPDNAVARNLIRMAGVALATTSANIADKPSPKNADDARAQLDGRVSYIVDGGGSKLGVESTIVDVSSNTPHLIREGYISWGELKEQLRL